MDKNQVMINYLLQYNKISSRPFFFNFANPKDNNNQFIASSNDKKYQKEFIDGSVEKRYMLTLIAYKSISFNPLVKQSGVQNENIDDLYDVQGFIDWIDTQNTARNFPSFGSDCIVEKISTNSENPYLSGVDTSIQPPLARYSITIYVDYIDNTNRIY